MSGFGREAGPSGQLNGQSPFVHNPRTPSPHPSTSPSLDFSGAPPRFPHRTSPLPSTPPSLDFSSAPRFPQVRSPPPSTSRSTNFSGAPRFSSPSHRTFEAVGRTPSPGSSLPFAASNRTFETVVRSPSTVATPNLAPGSSQPYVATNRDSYLRLGDRQSSVTGGFGDLSQRSSFPNNRGTSISSKVLPSQDPESFRRPRVQYDDDFLGDPVNDAMGGHADFTLNRHVVSQRRQSPTSDVARNHSVINPAASSGKSQRASISPPKSISKFGAVIDPKYSERMLSPNDGLHGDVRVTRLPNHSLTKRTRSPPAATGQVSLSSSPFTVNDAEREEQAKAKRLARFKTELNEVEPSVLVQRGPNVTHNKKNSLMNSMVTKNSMEELSQECDTEDLQSSNIIVGMCPDMCPESERGERERKGDLDRYERLDGDRNHTSKILAVKKYNRTAEREAELIRPMPILQKTMDYLLGLLDQPYDDRLLNLYNFLWDRMRAIRMDLRMQHIFNLKAITMLEQMIRLHVLAMHELCEFSRGEGFSEGFDAHLNIEQMNKTSVELFQLYDDHRKKGTPIPTEKEFRGYYALLKLDKHPGYKVEPAELSLDLAKMTAEIRQTQEILFARDVARSCRTGNFIAFFRHARKASYLQACLMHAHFSKLRTQALASLHSGLQYGQGVPVTHVAKWLGMEGEDIERLLEYHGFLMKEFEEPYMVKDGPFLHDDKDYPTRCSILVHRKKSDTIVEDVSSSHEIRSPTETKQFEKYSENKHTARQFVQTESPLNVSVGGDTGMEVELSPRGNFQGQTAFNGSRGTQVGLIPGSRKGQPFNDHQRVLTGSPRSKTGVPMTFSSVTSHVMQEEPSPLTPKGTLFISDDRQLNDEVSSRSFAADPLNLAPHTSSLGLAKQDEFKGPIQSSLNLIAHSDFNATPPLLVSEDVRESMSSDLEVAFVSATSPFNGVVMEELDEDKTDDVQEVENDDVGSNFDKEVAEAKLRLLLRLWRRRFVRKKKLYEENRLAANAALSSLSLGPPLWQSKEKPLHSRRLNIDKAVHERYEKWQESLIRWNVSDLVAAKLTEKNPVSNCVCWKVISFSWSHQETNDSKSRSSVANLSLDEWLRFKLIPPAKDETTEGLVMSAPGLSVWRKWTATNSRDTACYFSVIKDTTSGNSEINFVGASAILFPISETVSWNVQRAQLHNLVMSLPIEARIPLLVISGSRQVNLLQNSTDITDNLGLEELDRSRVGSYSIVCINDRDDTGQERHGYFSDPKMQDGLIWLASESRSQPILSWVTTRELVSLHLSSCLDALQHLGPDRVGPNQCISAFNEALDQSIKKIVTASKANPTGWPCPELFLLDESSAEFRAVKQCLPNLGWSTSEEVESLISALGSCKLPHFSEDLSWLGNGCNIEEELEEQRQLLQDCLIKYLTQTSNLMHWMMATNEANLMVQNYTRLELCDTEFQMVPNWVRIFRRVFNWQLNSSASFTKIAYVLEQSGFSCNLQSNMDVHMYPYSVHPSLDEMVEVSCSSPIVSKRVRSSPPKSLRNVAARTSGEKTDVVTLPSLAFEEQNKCSLIDCHSVDLDVDESNIHLVKGNLDLVTIDEKKDDRLIQLLNQCDILQDEIQKKLSIYY